MNLTFNHKNKKISLEVKRCNWFSMVRGLMFCRRKNAPALLLFDFKKPRRMKIHSWFVFFPFIAVWLDDKNNAIEIRKIEPWRFSVALKNSFCKLVEIPINKKYSSVTDNLLSRR